MPVLTRFRSAVTAGTVAALLLVLIFGSPWYRDWAAGLDPGTAGGWFGQLLAWPAWAVDADDSIRDAVSDVLRALLVVGFAAAFLHLLAGSQVGRARGSVSQLLAGWAAYIFAGGAAALAAALLRTDPSLLDAMSTAGQGAAYGLFVGWIVGIATLGGRPATGGG